MEELERQVGESAEEERPDSSTVTAPPEKKRKKAKKKSEAEADGSKKSKKPKKKSAEASSAAPVSEPAELALAFSAAGVGVIVDAGLVPVTPSSVIDWSDDTPVVVREGAGDVSDLT